jgi:myosin heavy subunit
LSLLICALLTVEEGLTWSNIAYNNNQAVIDLIAKRPTGLLNALEELSVLNRGQQDEGSLLAAYNTTHASNPLYERPRFGGNTSKLFTVKHYAGPVTYNVTGFLDKNNNALQEDLLTLLMCSSNAFVQNAIVATGMGVPPNAEHVGQPGYVPEVSADRIVQTAGKRVFVCAGLSYCCFPAC